MTQDLSKMERRLAQRFPLSERAVCETSAEATTQNPQETSQPNRFKAQIENVSKGGIGFSTAKALTTTEVIKIGFPAPTTEATIPTLAEVLWVRKQSNNESYRVGLSFML